MATKKWYVHVQCVSTGRWTMMPYNGFKTKKAALDACNKFNSIHDTFAEVLAK